MVIPRLVRSRFARLATPTGPTPTGSAPASTGHPHTDRRRAVVASAAVVTALAVLNVVRHYVPALPALSVLLGVGAAAALLVAARASGLSWAHLGLGRDRLLHGFLWGAGAIAVVAGVYLVGVLVPMTRPAFLDARYQLETSEALRTALVVIPLGTVLFEEIAFRSVLWGMLRRHMSTARVMIVSSALFGLWHVLPSLGFASARGADSSPAATALVVAGTVVFTAAGGAVAGELRRRSGHVLASAGMHWATNALGVLFGLIAWRLVAG